MGSTDDIARERHARRWEPLRPRRHCKFLFLIIFPGHRPFEMQATIRLLMSIGELGPLPEDAVVRPVSFRVQRRRLRGILEAHDRREDGTRETLNEDDFRRCFLAKTKLARYSA